MNLSIKGFSNSKDGRLDLPDKFTTLNPNAAEFVPSALRSTFGNTKIADEIRLDVPGPSAKAVLDRSASTISNNSDDEVQRLWYDQLPDDITPDFKNMGEDELLSPGQLSLAGLSLHDGINGLRLSASAASQLLGARNDISPRGVDSLNLHDNIGYLGSTYAEDQPSNAFRTLGADKWNKQLIDGDQHYTNGREGHHYNGNSSAALLSGSLNELSVVEDPAINPVEFLASQFPGFAAESLADIYFANGCDLNLTLEILTQLDLQVDAKFNHNLNPKSMEVAPSFNMLDFPALPAAENGLSKFSREDFQQASNAYTSPSNASRNAIDYASTVRKLASQDASHRKFERNGSADGSSSRTSQLLTNSYSGTGKLSYGDKLRNPATVRASPVWLETGEAVANLYSELREEARDFARLRNAYFEQARQAYLIGNGALARELSRKGQFYNMQMKDAHGKARETIYRQRNPVAPETRMQDRLIDLHGLHVTEAIHVLEHELSILRNTARSAGQRLQVMICVGTGHHTKGARTPARLPVAVEQFLLEEGLHFTQPQPGLLRVVIY